jgi:hypothetical protein
MCSVEVVDSVSENVLTVYAESGVDCPIFKKSRDIIFPQIVTVNTAPRKEDFSVRLQMYAHLSTPTLRRLYIYETIIPETDIVGNLCQSIDTAQNEKRKNNLFHNDEVHSATNIPSFLKSPTVRNKNPR